MNYFELTEMRLAPADLFAGLAEAPGSAFLDSALVDEHGLGRWSFLAWDPFLTLSARGDEVQVEEAGGSLRVTEPPLQVLRALLKRHASREKPGAVPFGSGAIGYLAYDLGYGLERLRRTAADDLGLPELCFGFHDFILAYDHVSRKWWLAGDALQPGDRPSLADRREEVLALAAKARADLAPPTSVSAPTRFRSNFERADYLAAIARAKRYIREGDIYQVNLSQRFQAPASLPAWPLYRRLRQTNPAPFAAFLHGPDFQILSSSPERFLKVKSGRVETRPIKGTRPRGETPEADRRLAEELLASEKDRAELNMIVDLERNDLGRVCAYGSVEVPRHAALESYARVHHLVSTVTGRLQPGKDAVDLIRAAFPGGSITGAPKIRAMQIIDELEPTARGVYTGAIGWLGFNGDLDLNIAIRTMVLKGGQVFFQAGGGIVADSDPELEYQETLDKAKALFEALAPVDSEQALVYDQTQSAPGGSLDSNPSKPAQTLQPDMGASPLSDSAWRAVFEWCRETGVEFYLKLAREENPSIEMRLRAVESVRVVTGDRAVPFAEIEWIKIPFETPFLGKVQPDIRPFLRRHGLRFEERPDGVVIRGSTPQPAPSA